MDEGVAHHQQYNVGGVAAAAQHSRSAERTSASGPGQKMRPVVGSASPAGGPGQIGGPGVQGTNGANQGQQSLSNIQKINARLRARNHAVVMSMATPPQMLLPLSQRSLSPSSYQQLSTQ